MKSHNFSETFSDVIHIKSGLKQEAKAKRPNWIIN